MPIAPNYGNMFNDIEPWPTKPDANPRAVQGDNKPPPEETIPAEFLEELLKDKPKFLIRLEDAIGSADRAKAIDDATLAKCADLQDIYRDIISHINATHKTVKEPYLEGGRIVDTEKKKLLTRVEEAKGKVQAIADTFVAKRAEDARIERERLAQIERDRIAQEQVLIDAAQDEFPDAEINMTPRFEYQAPMVQEKAPLIRSDTGATVSGKVEWHSEVQDFALAFAAVSDDTKVQIAIADAVKRRVKAGVRKIDGVKITSREKASFR